MDNILNSMAVGMIVISVLGGAGYALWNMCDSKLGVFVLVTGNMLLWSYVIGGLTLRLL